MAVDSVVSTSEGVVKLNTAGAARGNLGMAGAGGLIRSIDSPGRGDFANESAGIATAVTAEKRCLKTGLGSLGH
ncbi:hypothetical protein CRG98_016799 [Punica granatum]|uniref:Uncharacterized protein n=1 Tax=Punica granatum TaxID=22663 RepID=A0A2I0K2R2_PUNGR|nr:hypothetical protein CRG98_016799 [Punica granatum]